MSTNENWEFIQENEIDITLKNLIFLFIIIIFLSCKEDKTENKVVKELKDSETNNKNSKEEFVK